MMRSSPLKLCFRVVVIVWISITLLFLFFGSEKIFSNPIAAITNLVAMNVVEGETGRPSYLKYDDVELLNRMDAECIVLSLVLFPIEQVGGRKWLTQHANLEKLNLQAHYNTMVHCDEFVMVVWGNLHAQALTSHYKLGLLIQELLVIEIWKERVLPHILKELAEQTSNINIHLVLYQETTIINLLEVILYHREVCEAMDADSLLELTDYCYRKIVYLNTQGAEDATYKERSGSAIHKMTPEEDLREKTNSMEFGIAVCSISVLRYLTDFMGDLPLSVMARMLDCHDILMALIPMVENPPWQRKRTRSGKPVTEKYAEGKWTEVQASDRFKLTKTDAQLWLCIYNLIVDKRCRLKYTYDDFRRSTVLKLRKYLNDLLTDQLPVLNELKWAVEQLVIQVPQTTAESASGRLIIEQVPELREKLKTGKNWRVIAEKQLKSVFSEASSATQSQAQEMLKLFQFGELMEQPTCAACKKAAVQRCSRCKCEWYLRETKSSVV